MSQIMGKRSNILGNRKPVVIEGLRTPFVRSFGTFGKIDSLEIFSRVVSGLIRKLEIDDKEIDEISSGVVFSGSRHSNIARDAVINLGLSTHITGYTTNRSCASSLHTIAEAAKSICYGNPALILSGGVECIDAQPLGISHEARQFISRLNQSTTTSEKLLTIKDMSAKPWATEPPELTEPFNGLPLTQHLESMIKCTQISRESQDLFALRSHQTALKAQRAGILEQEIEPVWPSSDPLKCSDSDEIIEAELSIEKLKRTESNFDPQFGTITPSNTAPIADGAAINLVADEQRALSIGLKPKAYISDFIFNGIDPCIDHIIGPSLSILLLLKKNKLKLEDIDLFEIHEGFAAEVLSCLQNLESRNFHQKYFNSIEMVSSIPEDKINVNGGSIAIGHPIGATGSRLVTALCNELIRRDKQLGVAAISTAGDMSGAILIERAN